MRVNNQNNISFGTNIKVISPKCFKHIVRNVCMKPGFEFVDRWMIKGYPYELGYRTNLEFGATARIRTCAAGITVKKGSRPPLFWHILDSAENINNFPILEKKIKGDSAILVGTKSYFHYSKILCGRFKKALHDKKIMTTMLTSLAPKWEANIAYSSKKDTMFICVKECFRDEPYVKSMEQLKEVFGTIKISPVDKLSFANPIEELFMRGLIKR